ncbi:hypothetical protein [Myroides marinus]|uniref:hypothetical protein n=1 Tax=Myroides marinus TaxID=703342 RepID=UPI002574E36D|nr:hypothetical protein [Myroides marinus]MDM1534222.1 hypothetical protein [Myroides marinus]MDM1541186.1 hypothetical protein [Myroides marinus]
MKKYSNNPINAFQHKRQGKDKDFKAEYKVFLDYLKTCVSTCSMVASETGIPHKNLTRYKAKLEKQGLLWCVEKNYCKKTKRKAWYLTTNPDLIPFDNQLTLF